MIGRLWTARVTEAQAADYECFARTISLPMFRSQPGFRGALMLRRGQHCLVLTLWHDQASIDALECSESYARTVREILARGFLHGEQSVESLDVHLLADLPG